MSAVIKTPTLQKIVEELAAKSLSTGKPPAQLVVRFQFAQLSDADRMMLMRVGLASRIVDELALIRRSRPDRDLVEDIHAQVRCPFTSHMTSWDKRQACVSRIVSLPPQKRQAAIIEMRRRNEESADHFDATWTRSMEKFGVIANDLAESAVREALESIGLAGADGQMRSLYAFTRADVEMWQQKSQTLVTSWEARESWFADTLDALSRHGVPSIGDLPLEIKSALADRAIEIWKKS